MFHPFQPHHLKLECGASLLSWRILISFRGNIYFPRGSERCSSSFLCCRSNLQHSNCIKYACRVFAIVFSLLKQSIVIVAILPMLSPPTTSMCYNLVIFPKEMMFFVLSIFSCGNSLVCTKLLIDFFYRLAKQAWACC